MERALLFGAEPALRATLWRLLLAAIPNVQPVAARAPNIETLAARREIEPVGSRLELLRSRGDSSVRCLEGEFPRLRRRNFIISCGRVLGFGDDRAIRPHDDLIALM